MPVPTNMLPEVPNIYIYILLKVKQVLLKTMATRALASFFLDFQYSVLVF